MIINLLFAFQLHAQSSPLDGLPGGVRLALRLTATPALAPTTVTITPLGRDADFYARAERLADLADDARLRERRLARERARLAAILGSADAEEKLRAADAETRAQLTEARRALDQAEAFVARARVAARAAARAVNAEQMSHFACARLGLGCDAYAEAQQAERVRADRTLSDAEAARDRRARVVRALEDEVVDRRRDQRSLADLRALETAATADNFAGVGVQLDVVRLELDQIQAGRAALNGFYSIDGQTWSFAVNAPACVRAFTYHRAVDDGRHPFFAEPVDADQRDFGFAPLVVCTDEAGRLTSVRAFDANLALEAYSEISYADGRVTAVVVKDRAGQPLESARFE